VFTGLTAWTKQYMEIRAHNDYGFGPVAKTEASPQSIPAAPESLSLVSASGSEIMVYWLAPASGVGAVSMYTVEWDTNEFFTHAQGVPTCGTSGHGICDLPGIVSTQSGNYSYLIQNLNIGVNYFVRVAARNSLSAATVYGPLVADDTNWSQSAVAVPKDQPPSIPQTLSALASGATFVQLVVKQPLITGGKAVSHYLFEYDTSDAFDSANKGLLEVTEAALSADALESGDFVQEVSGLKIGRVYNFRVSAKNEIGYSIPRISSNKVLLGGKPSAPAMVTLSTLSSSNQPITSIQVAWTASEEAGANGGNDINGWVIEYFEMEAVHEVQVVQFISVNASLSNPTTTFRALYSSNPNRVSTTEQLPFDIKDYNFRRAVMMMGKDNASYPIDDIRVARSAIPGLGHQWHVTFVSEKNMGNVPPIVAKPSNPDGGKCEVIEMQPGSRAGGLHEEQVLTIASATARSQLSGFFKMSFNGSEEFTRWLSYDASTEEMERALEQLPTLRDMTVSKEYGTKDIIYTITFTGAIGDQPALSVLSSVNDGAGDAIVTLDEGDNAVDQLTGRKRSFAMPGEMPKGYNQIIVPASARQYTIEGLVPGKPYYVTVAARNQKGIGTVTMPSPPSATPPKQIPGSPENVKLHVNPLVPRVSLFRTTRRKVTGGTTFSASVSN
jgi:hypothetical protein